MSEYVNSMSTLQLWFTGSALSLVLWLGIVLPLGYRLLLVPWASAPFWTRMSEDKPAAVMLVLMLALFGAATVQVGLIGLVFLVLVTLFKGMFYLLCIASQVPRHSSTS